MIPLGVISSSSLSAFSLPPLGLVGHWDASKFSNFTPVNTWTDQTGLGDMVVPQGAYGFDARVPALGDSTSLQGYYIQPKTGGKLHRSMPPKYFEVALYNRTLTTSEVSSAHSYAKAKWSL